MRIELNHSFLVFLIATTTTFCASVQPAERGVVPRGIPLRGRVLYPDSSPAAGATVVATTICEDTTVHLVDDTLTSDDGSFAIPSFDTSCGKIHFTAEKRDGFWLKTGEGVFYPRPNGTDPELDLAGTTPPDPVTIQLDLRGAELEVTVWDESTEQRIEAGVYVECPDSWCGAMSIATGEDGAAHTIFIAPRRYVISLNWYKCGAKTYFASDAPSLTVEVVEGRHQLAVLKVDLSLIRAKSSYDNPDGEPCRL